MAASALAVRRRKEGARPGAIVLAPLGGRKSDEIAAGIAGDCLSSLAFNAFNYQLLGEAGFDAVLTSCASLPPGNWFTATLTMRSRRLTSNGKHFQRVIGLDRIHRH
jgi:hypothetical protein